MTDLIIQISDLLYKMRSFMESANEEKLTQKPFATRWSKKEILGHLIDSGINNLQRFTEIQFQPKPYTIRKYNQDQLVKANGYQHANIAELLNCWLQINKRIIHIIEQQSSETLAYRVSINSSSDADLKFLIEDYVAHMEHHLLQIMDENYLTAKR